MYGYDIASLNIYSRSYVGGPRKLLLSLVGQRGDEWLRARINLTFTEPSQVLIEGVRNSGFGGKISIDRLGHYSIVLSFSDDIGIDDTSFTPSCQVLSSATLPSFIYSTTPSPYCNSAQSHCLVQTGQCLPKEQFCNFNDECRDRTDELSCPPTCSFENRDLCKWNHDLKEKLKWDFGNGNTASSNTGPAFGKYLFSLSLCLIISLIF